MVPFACTMFAVFMEHTESNVCIVGYDLQFDFTRVYAYTEIYALVDNMPYIVNIPYVHS